MQLPQIQMQSQMAKIAINQLPGKLEIKQPKADLSIEQPKADISIQTSPAKLTIDQSQAWEDMNLMSTKRFIESSGQEGISRANEGTGRRAEQGDQLMRIENGGNPIINQAIINGHDQMSLIGLKYIPSVFSVKLNYEQGEFYFDARVNQPVIHAQVNQPELNYERGSVAIEMKQYAELNIDFNNLFSEMA